MEYSGTLVSNVNYTRTNRANDNIDYEDSQRIKHNYRETYRSLVTVG